MESHMINDKHFYKIVNSQRDCRAQKLTQLQVDGEMLQKSDDIAEGWVRYFQNLSKRLESDNFNAKYQEFVQLDYKEIEDFCRNNYKSDTEFVSLELLDKLVCEMKNGKYQDEQLLSAEHFKFGGPSLIYLLKSIFEKIFKEGTVPNCFKSGIITPVYKKQDKPINNPNSYRRITVSSVIGKLFEKVILHKISPLLKESQNPLQRGFSKDVAPTNASLLLTEAIAESLDNNVSLYAAYIDASKAFDVVWHESMLRKLFYTGISKETWILTKMLYQDLHSKVKWEGKISSPFYEQQGVRQGGILSPELYKVFINPLLDFYKNNYLGFRIGSIQVNSPTCADDIVLLGRSQLELQTMLLGQEQYANDERCIISEAKSKVMIFNQKKQHIDENCTLHDRQIAHTESYTHIGIDRKLRGHDMIEKRIKLARRTTYALMGTGMHGYNGINPSVIIRMWNMYVRPRMLFGLDCVLLSKKDYSKLSSYHKSFLKMIMNLSDAAIYILSGELPLESFIHSQILLKLCSIIRYGGIEKELCMRQVLIKDVSSHSWFLYAKEILDFYDLPSVFELISVTPAKEKWKTCIKNKIHEYWKMQIEKWSVGKSTIRYLIPRTKENGTVHNVWKNAGMNRIAIMKASTKAKLLSGTYILQQTQSKFKKRQISAICLMCNSDIEDTPHFLIKCSSLERTRQPFIDKIKALLNTVDKKLYKSIYKNDIRLTQLILDVTSPTLPMRFQTDELIHEIESLTRGLCFALHHERCRLLDIAVRPY